MTKNKTAICTPTATREEFESILRELDPVGVKWVHGGERPLEWTKFFSPFLRYEDLELSNSNSAADSKQLPRAEFISAIKRDFAPKIDCSYPTEIKEQPKMNYNKMTKAELIGEIDNTSSQMQHLQGLINRSDVDLVQMQEQRDTARATADKYGKQCATLEKTNAEQAETIKDLNSRLLSSEGRNIKTHDRLTKEAQKAYKAQHENTRIKRLAAQILCPDVWEGK